MMMTELAGGFREKKNPAVRPGVQQAVSRLRIRIWRTAEAAGISPREQLGLFREMAEKSGLSCALKSGNVKMSFGPAIAEGYESRAEYADLYINGFVGNAAALAALGAVCPQGYSLMGVRRVPTQFPSVEEMLSAVSYTVEGGFFGTAEELAAQTAACGVITREKSDGRLAEFHPAELMLGVESGGPGAFRLLMTAGAGKNLRPELLLSRLAGRELVPGNDLRIVREEFYWRNSDGQLVPVWD